LEKKGIKLVIFVNNISIQYIETKGVNIMEGVLSGFLNVVLKKEEKVEKIDNKMELLTELKNIKKKIDAANSRFDYQFNMDLIDSTIYELQSLDMQYRYLLKSAKEQGIRC
jgi:hypothetical protein